MFDFKLMIIQKTLYRLQSMLTSGIYSLAEYLVSFSVNFTVKVINNHLSIKTNNKKHTSLFIRCKKTKNVARGMVKFFRFLPATSVLPKEGNANNLPYRSAHFPLDGPGFHNMARERTVGTRV
ncbi:hypothetical protein D7D25_07955 [Proteiniphilum sp. X52]|nr:hypothetical protein D7D25_07955 [Proteiniphilum sp. X52]